MPELLVHSRECVLGDLSNSWFALLALPFGGVGALIVLSGKVSCWASIWPSSQGKSLFIGTPPLEFTAKVKKTVLSPLANMYLRAWLVLLQPFSLKDQLERR